MGPDEVQEQVPQGDAQPAAEDTAPQQSQPVAPAEAQAVPINAIPGQNPQAGAAAIMGLPRTPVAVEEAKKSHMASIGSMLMGAMGKDVNYSVDPQTGQTVANITDMKPGEFFRRILAGALVGGAVGGPAGAKAEGSPLAAAAAGASGAQQMLAGQDAQRREQAQDQFKDQMKAQENQRQNDESDVNQQLTRAQIAASNANTYRTNVASQGSDFDTHQRVAAAGKANTQSYVEAGLKPAFDQIPESEMHDLAKNNPGFASQFDWEPVGVKEQTDDQGNHSYEYVYSAFDPKGKVPLSPQTLDQWKKDGFLDSMGQQASDVLQPGKQLDANQFIALKNRHTLYAQQQEGQRQLDQKKAMDKAKLDAENALADQRQGAAAKNNASAANGGTTPRARRAQQTATAVDAADSLPDGQPHPLPAHAPTSDKEAGTMVSRAAANVMSGFSTIDDVGKGMGKEAAGFRRQVQDSILQKNPEYDFEGQKAESKEFNSIPVRTKLAANVTLTGSDGKSGLLSKLQTEAHAAGITQLPALNDGQSWARIESGSPKGVTLHQLMNDVAEQYGAIFAQGGATSDAKIKLAQENFPKNFNTGQIDESVRGARLALGDRMRVLADHNRFIRAHYGASIPVQIQDEKGRIASTSMDRVDKLLADNQGWKRVN